MELWSGVYAEFQEGVDSEQLFPNLEQAFRKRYGCLPGDSEQRAWRASLAAVADAVDISRPGDVALSVEYHLPLSGQRIDVIFCGRDDDKTGYAVVVELKQWSEALVEDEYSENLMVGGSEHLHPSQQAFDYASFLADYHSAFVDGDLYARSCSFCHNLQPAARQTLRDQRYHKLLKDSPLFTGSEGRKLSTFIDAHVAQGGGPAVIDRIRTGRFKPSPKVIQRLDAVLRKDERWTLLDTQRKAYNTIVAHLRRTSKRGGRSAVLVRGGPGTGKTVIAVQLLADALRDGFAAAHSTGGKAFTTAMRSKFKGADKLFIWNMSTREAPYQGLDLLLVDEAHRIRETSDTRFTPKKQRGRKSQVNELLDAAKVTVFLLDENQFMRPDEVGESNLIREATSLKNIPLKEYDLATQFRCGGCTEYLDWVDYLLGFRAQKPLGWGDRYRFELVGAPEDLDLLLEEADAAGESSRLLGGFCWPWSDPLADGTLVDDIVVGDWRRPWNRKRSEKKQYKPENDPYTLWAETAEGRDQVGCVYSAQGFEFDRVGILWGEDLVWRGGQWVSQKQKSFDRPVKGNSQMTRLVRNAYRVLLTRGMKETRLLCLDPETKAHLASVLAKVQQQTYAQHLS